jgi:arylsulfatase A-like enzyme
MDTNSKIKRYLMNPRFQIMNIRRIITYLLILVMSPGYFNCDPANKATTELPNIILCMADDQGWGDMAYNGHPVLQTPGFDDMAADALCFDRFYAAAPICSPTRGSVMTGRHPNRFACFSPGHALRPQEITIAEALKKAGYVTGHFGKWHLGSVRQGSPVSPGAIGFDEWLSAPNFFDNNPILSHKGLAVPTQGESSMVIVNAALEFIRKNESLGKPLFAVIWFGSPHSPFEATDEFASLYDDQPELLQHYYGEITGMDRAFGKLRAELSKLSTYENTILWYCSDNGGKSVVSIPGGRGDKGDIYEGGLRVPAMLEWPARIKEPRITTFPASTSDIFPTLLNIVGIRLETNRPIDGISLVPLIDKQIDRRDRPLGFWRYPMPGIYTHSGELMQELLESQKNGNMIGDSSRLLLEEIKIRTQYPSDTLTGHAAWLDWPWKLHRIQAKSGNIQWELYRLDKDPQESVNLINVHPDCVSEMKISLEKWQRSVVRSMYGWDY